MKKVLSLILIVVGVILILLSFSQIRSALSLELPPFASENMILFIGAGVAIVGAFLNLNKKSKKHKEVPIYHGKDVVGFRRI